MNEKTFAEYNEASVKVSLWLDSSGDVGFCFQASHVGGATPENLAITRKAMLKFSDKLQELIVRQKELAPKPEQTKKYCYGFYPNPEMFYDWETFQDMLFDGRLHGEEVEVVRGVRVEFDNEDFISPHQIGEDILAQADDEGGEYAEAYDEEVSAFFDNNEEKVRSVLSQMMELFDIRPTFFSVEKEETVTVVVGNRDEGHIV